MGDFATAIQLHKKHRKVTMHARGGWLGCSYLNSYNACKYTYIHLCMRAVQTSDSRGRIIALCNEGLGHRCGGDLVQAEAYHKR